MNEWDPEPIKKFPSNASQIKIKIYPKINRRFSPSLNYTTLFTGQHLLFSQPLLPPPPPLPAHPPPLSI